MFIVGDAPSGMPLIERTERNKYGKINTTDLKIPSGGKQIILLFRGMTEELNWDLPRNNSS